MATYLDRILAAHRAAAAADDRDIAPLVAEALARPPARGFAAALAGGRGHGDRGHRRGQAAVAVEGRPRRRARPGGPGRPTTSAGGATCLSVLTDASSSAARRTTCGAAREATGLPVLRKDFTVVRRATSATPGSWVPTPCC